VRQLLVQAAEQLGLTARGYHRVLRVGRTIADLDNAAAMDIAHVAEALRYRPVGRHLRPPGTTGSSNGAARTLSSAAAVAQLGRDGLPD
jgi:hypothetical protein